MQCPIKNSSPVSLAAFVALISISFAAISFGTQFEGSRNPETFSVQSTAEVFAAPDMAQFSFAALSESESLEQAYPDNEKIAGDIVTFLLANGVQEKYIQTSGLSVNPRYTYYRCKPGAVCPPATINGYSVRKTFTVKTRELADVGGLLAGVVKYGARDVSSLQFVIEDDEVIRAQARAEAIAQAQTKAEEISSVSGLALGKLISVDESFGRHDPPMLYARAESAMGGGMDAKVDSTLAGENKVTATVTLRYLVK